MFYLKKSPATAMASAPIRSNLGAIFFITRQHISEVCNVVVCGSCSGTHEWSVPYNIVLALRKKSQNTVHRDVL